MTRPMALVSLIKDKSAPVRAYIKNHRQSLTFALVAGLFAFAVLVNLLAVNVSMADASFSIDLSGLLSVASNMFNQLFPVFGPVIGITLAFAIIAYVINEIRRAI